MKKIILVITFLLVVSGCESHVLPDHYRDAEKMCKSHKGVNRFDTAFPFWIGNLYCNDGSSFDNWSVQRLK